VLYIKAGIYQEYIDFNKSMTNLMVIGDGRETTRIVGNKNFVDGINTYHTATVGT
jgi:pectinesterase